MARERGTMPNRQLVLGLLLLCATPAWADEPTFTLTPYAGYLLGPNVETDTSKVRIRDSRDVGLRLDFPYRGNALWRLVYARSNTRLEQRDATSGNLQDSFNLRVEYLQLGGIGYFETGRTSQYVSSTLGLTHYTPNVASISSETLLTLSLGLGAQLALNKQWGLEAQGRLLLPVQITGGSLFCGPGGCRLELSGQSSLLHAELSAGVSFRF